MQIDEPSFRAATDRPEGKEALNRFGELIVSAFMKSLSPEDASRIRASLDTEAGRAAFRENWPRIVDAYFQALRAPKR